MDGIVHEKICVCLKRASEQVQRHCDGVSLGTYSRHVVRQVGLGTVREMKERKITPSTLLPKRNRYLQALQPDSYRLLLLSLQL